jgi:hypothetical protein
LVPDALMSASRDRGLPAEYKAASILAVISSSGRAGSRKVCVSLSLYSEESIIYYFIALLLFLLLFLLLLLLLPFCRLLRLGESHLYVV